MFEQRVLPQPHSLQPLRLNVGLTGVPVLNIQPSLTVSEKGHNIISNALYKNEITVAKNFIRIMEIFLQ